MPIFSAAATLPYVQQVAAETSSDQVAPPSAPSTAAPPSDWFDKVARTLYWTGGGLDTASSGYAMTQPFREANPFYSWAGKGGVVPLMVGTDVAGYFALKHVLKNHPTALNWVLTALGAGHLAGGIHNVAALINFANQPQPVTQFTARPTP